ncbi:Sec-independent protein translocase protein TatB [Nitratireductor luteus]|uniref:Sec-independent protein translocase protein TatB n=1 Tax=Nitratireductor luteus TaxID=2976980 RepID=UPI00224067A2|nr:Sec-independent protein translocase protein TatB [Nitratireductor luteus]
MFDLGWPEILVIAIVLIVVVGPKDLPRLLRGFGRTTTKMREMAGDFRKQFDDAMKEAELDDVKNLVDDARKLDPRNEIKKHLSPLEKAGRDVRAGLDDAMKPKPAKPAETASTEARAVEPAKKAPANSPATKPEVAKKPASKAASSGKSTSTAAPKTKPAPKAKPASGKTAAKPAARKPAARKTTKTGTAS